MKSIKPIQYIEEEMGGFLMRHKIKIISEIFRCVNHNIRALVTIKILGTVSDEVDKIRNQLGRQKYEKH